MVHTIRIPIEIVLHFLEEAGAIAPQMSFTGWNFDIVRYHRSSGRVPRISRKIPQPHIAYWLELSALGLVLTIVGISIAAFRLRSHRSLSSAEPGRVLFPVCLVPSVIVPIVVFATLHLFTNSLRTKFSPLASNFILRLAYNLTATPHLR